KLPLAFVPLADNAHDAMRAYRQTVRACEPAAGVFQPNLLGARCRFECILRLVGHASAGIALARFGHDVEAGLPAFGIDLLREAAAACDDADVGDAQRA